ncbi:MAG TPA: hypothetical protein PK821_08155, partial [Victivallales bacterium]|nr:hypothetical protein [Victivallales bacterium]
IFRSDILRTAFPGIYLILYFGYVSIPSYMKWGAFCRRVPHDWRSAIVHIRDNYEPGDAILLRCGEVKENWIASENVNPIVKDYVKAPFHSFYWDKDSSVPLPTIFNMTYTWEKEFYTYYEETFSNLVAKKRVWLIGVDPPNTNYKFSTVAQFMHDEYMFKKLWDSNFSGVYVALLESNPVLRQKAAVPSYYDDIRREIKKSKNGTINAE